MSRQVLNVPVMTRYRGSLESSQTDMCILTSQLEKQHDIDGVEIQGGYRWKPEHDTLGDVIREHEDLRGIQSRTTCSFCC